jgi:hypothetical protein
VRAVPIQNHSEIKIVHVFMCTVSALIRHRLRRDKRLSSDLKEIDKMKISKSTMNLWQTQGEV